MFYSPPHHGRWVRASLWLSFPSLGDFTFQLLLAENGSSQMRERLLSKEWHRYFVLPLRKKKLKDALNSHEGGSPFRFWQSSAQNHLKIHLKETYLSLPNSNLPGPFLSRFPLIHLGMCPLILAGMGSGVSSTLCTKGEMHCSPRGLWQGICSLDGLGR